MRRRLLKKKILSLLEECEWPEIRNKINEYKEKDIINHLFTSLCSTNESCKWHGVSAFGVIVPKIAERDIESARVIMRRFLWCLNDESGGIGWGIPEAMGEVMANHNLLFEEYSHMLISYMREDGQGIFMDGNHLELPALQRGVLWGAARLLEVKTKEMVAKRIAYDLPPYLKSPDKVVQGLAIYCARYCGNDNVLKGIEPFTHSTYRFTLYRNNTFTELCVGDVAKIAMQEIQARVQSN